jgi:hypothetical protein
MEWASKWEEFLGILIDSFEDAPHRPHKADLMIDKIIIFWVSTKT